MEKITKFTPGPWALDYIEGIEWGISAWDDGELTIGIGSSKDLISREDASLIASAPDLYEALEALVKDDHIPEWKRISINMLLAKACGES